MKVRTFKCSVCAFSVEMTTEICLRRIGTNSVIRKGMTNCIWNSSEC